MKQDAGRASAIPLLREHEAQEDRLKDTFRDIKAGFRIPVVVEVFQAWAAVPHFLEVVWRRLRPNVLAQPFVESARALREATERAVAAWPAGDHAADLRARNVGEADVSRMREISQMFLGLDHKLLIVVQAVRLALEGDDVGGGAHGPPGIEAAGNDDFRGLPMQLVDERDAPFRVRAIFEAMKKSLSLPYLPSEYRALAAFPDWLDIWWQEVHGAFEHARYASALDELVAGALERARQVPYRIRLSADILANFRINDGARRRLLDVTRELCDTQPRLCINMAIARRGLGGPAPA